jgi:glycosyltransferase involved in cell wall biosynthesis
MRPVNVPKSIQQLYQPTESIEERLQFIRHHYAAITSNTPDVSIVIPAYNEEKNILQTLASLAANQTKFTVEIIVVNNNSKDNTEALVTSSGVTCITEKKQGITAARNAGLQAAKGIYILNADADAIYPQQWINEMIMPLHQSKNIAVTYGRFSFIPTGVTGRTTYFCYEHIADAIRLVNKKFKEEAVNVYGFNSAFRREQGILVNGFDHPQGTNEDGYLALKLRDQGFGKLYYVTNIKALVWTSDRRIQSDGGLWKALKKRFTKMFFYSRFKETRTDL